MVDHDAHSLVHLYFVTATCLPNVYTRCVNAASANFVAAISRTNSNWFEFVQLIAATEFCCSDNYVHNINSVTRGVLLHRLVPTTCRSDLSPNVSRPLYIFVVFKAVVDEQGLLSTVSSIEGIFSQRNRCLSCRDFFLLLSK